MNYIEVNIEITPFSEEFSEIVVSVIEDLPFESFVNEAPFLKAYISQDAFCAQDLKTLLSSFDGMDSFKIKVSHKFIEYQNWNQVWESNFNPIVVGQRCTVKAGFHKDLPNTEYNIVIDPKMAFGTGHHQTTHLMIEAMLDHEFKGKQVLDMGCGTGILAILAVLRGANFPVDAIDIDPIAAESARENSEKNGVGNKINVLTGDSSLVKKNQYDIILANINRNIILSDIEVYSSALKSDGTIILSGFYSQDAPAIEQACLKQGLTLVSQTLLDNWILLKFKKY